MTSSIEGCVELVANGDFEVERSGWTFPSTGAGYTDEITYDGSGQAIRVGSLDGPNVADISIAEQLIDLPDDYERIVLDFRYYPIADPDPGPGDLQYVDIHNFFTEQFEDRVLSVKRNDRRWLQLQSDLSDLPGQRIRLRFAVNNDGVGGRSAMYIDNVSIRACGFTGDAAPKDPNATVTSWAQEESPTATSAGTSSADATADAQLTASAQSTSDASGSHPTSAGTGAAAWTNRLGMVAVLAGVLVVIALLVWGILYALRPNDPS